MNNQTESLKRSMYDCLARIKAHSDRQIKHRVLLEFEERLEEYLEAARKDSAALIAIAGQEMRAFQDTARQYLLDVQSAEKYSDLFSEQLGDAKMVLATQEKMIEGQHTVIGRLYMEKYSGANCGNPGHANFCRCTL